MASLNRVILFGVIALSLFELAVAQSSSITLLGPRLVVSLLPGTSCLDIKQPGHEIPYRVCFDYLREITPEGVDVCTYSFPSLLWNKYSNFTTANATSTLPNGANVSLAALVYVNDTHYHLGNLTFLIPQNDLMWKFEVSAWPFASDTHLLALNWTMSHPAMRSWKQFNSSVPYPSTTLEISASGIPDWLVALFHVCLADNTTRSNLITTANYEEMANTSRLNAQITFPHFSKNVRMISITWIESPPNTISLDFILGAVGVCVGVVLIGAVVGLLLPYFLLRKDYERVR